METISPRELSRALAEGQSVLVIDVREPHEWDLARIPGARLVPLHTLPQAAQQLERAADIVVYCHHGSRSEMGANILLRMGFQRVRNLVGGIDGWSRDVDPRTPRY